MLCKSDIQAGKICRNYRKRDQSANNLTYIERSVHMVFIQGTYVSQGNLTESLSMCTGSQQTQSLEISEGYSPVFLIKTCHQFSKNRQISPTDEYLSKSW